jgi:hypothetical protein
MSIEQIDKHELRVNENVEELGNINISISDQGIILDLYESNDKGDPISVGFTYAELAEFIKEFGVK